MAEKAISAGQQTTSVQRISHPRSKKHDHGQDMTRSYDREVRLCVPTDCIEKFRPVHPLVPRFDDLYLYEHEHENYNVWENGQTGQLEERGGEKSEEIPTKDEREDHLNDSERFLDVGSAYMKHN